MNEEMYKELTKIVCLYKTFFKSQLNGEMCTHGSRASLVKLCLGFTSEGGVWMKQRMLMVKNDLIYNSTQAGFKM